MFYLSRLKIAERANDAALLRAAMGIDRTSTGDIDRGKGLADMQEFIKQRKNGYLSILSKYGLFKYSNDNGTETTKSETLESPILGTLIIWKTVLE